VATPTKSKELALQVARSLLKQDLSDDLLISFCLSRVDAKRTAYDRFSALRDMSRALVLVSLVAAVGIVFANGERVATDHKMWLVVGSLAAAVGFFERFIRYRPLANEALFGQFLSNETIAPPKQS